MDTRSVFDWEIASDPLGDNTYKGKLTANAALDPPGLVDVVVCHAFALFVAVSIAANISSVHVNLAVRAKRWSNPKPRFRSISALSPSLAPEEEMLTRHHEASADMETRNNVYTFENSTSTENVLSTSTLTRSLTLPTIETSLTLCHTLNADESGEKPTEPPAMYLEGPKGLSSSDLHDKLEYAKTNVENTKQKVFEQSIQQWRAEEDAKEALDKLLDFADIKFELFRTVLESRR
ncbi:U-box domain-containing protein 33-like protein isoform X1 [Tanacetum coccineum]